MAKSIKAALAIAATTIIALFSSCEKDEYPLAGSGRYHSGPVIEDVTPGEKVKEYTYRDLRMRFVEGELEDSFIPVTITDRREIHGSRIAEKFNVNAKGVEVQYFEPKTENFKEEEGAQSELEAKVLDHNNGWVENLGGKVYSWNATNVDDAADCPYAYRDTARVSSSSYIFVPDSLSGYEVKFPAVNIEVKAGEKKTEEVDGVVYNGKVWNALKVSYLSVVTLTIPEVFRMDGEQYEMTFDIVNVVFYLRHEVDTKVENLLYEVNIIENILKIEKEYQTLNFDIVTRDNGEVKNSVSYKLEEAFDITAVKVEDVELFDEDGLKDTKVTLTKGNITSNTEVDEIFSKITYSGSDHVAMSDGRSTDVTISYDGYAWGFVEFPYASVVSRKADLKSVRNEEESNSTREVYDVTLTLSYDVTYNNSDKKDETKVITIAYKRYMVIHNVNTKVENLAYKVNILENGLSIDKEYQTLNFDIVTRDNGEVKESNSYKLEESFDITAVEVEDVEVSSEAALKDTKVTLTKGNITSNAEVEEIFSKITYSGSDHVAMSDGRSTDVAISYEGYAWGSVEFPYASVVSRKAELKSVENVSESSSSKKVYDVTLTLSYDITYNNSDKKDETKVIVITYKRFYNVPDDYSQTVTATNFQLQYVQPDESQMGTSVERNTVLVQKFNHGEFVSDSTYNHDSELSAKLSCTSSAKVKVENVQDLTVILQAKGGYKTTYSQKDENGIQNMTVSRKYEVRVSDGSTYELVIADETPRRNGEDFGHHAEFNDAAFQPIVALQPTLNPSSSSATEKVYDVKVSVSMPINRTDKVATKAANDNADVFTVSASHQELVEVKDEYIPGQDRTVWTVTANGNGYDIVGEHFETWTLSGEIRTDRATRRVNVSLKNVDGSMKTVKNVDKYVTSGNGHTGTGSGTYTDNAGNTVSADAFTNEYLWSADGSLTVTLKGKGGNGASKTFDPTFVMTEGGQQITKASEAEAYISYTYTNTVNAVYGLDGKEIKLSATDTRELRVEKEVEVLVGDLVAAGMSVVPAHQEGNGFADGSGKQSATMNITLIRKDGSAAPIVYAFEVAGTCQLPSDDQLKNAKFFAGSYDGSYDSALYNNGEWVPAVAHDASEGIFYTAPEYGKTRSIRNETLNKMWGWRNGNLSTQVSDYTIKVTDGVCTIWYNGQIVKQFR